MIVVFGIPTCAAWCAGDLLWSSRHGILKIFQGYLWWRWRLLKSRFPPINSQNYALSTNTASAPILTVFHVPSVTMCNYITTFAPWTLASKVISKAQSVVVVVVVVVLEKYHYVSDRGFFVWMALPPLCPPPPPLPPASPWEFPVTLCGGVWIFSGTAHYLHNLIVFLSLWEPTKI